MSGPTATANASEDGAIELGPRAVTYPYRRIERPVATPSDGPDPYGNPSPEWLSVDWSKHQRWIEVDGAPVNYVEIGAGAPVVFIHGLGGCWQTWLENLPHFAAAGRRAIAMDLPGFGHSPMPEWEITMPAYARLVERFCEALSLQSATIVGNSMGGFVAAEVALDEPRWIDRLVLVSAAGISHATMRREPVLAGARMLAAFNPIALHMSTRGLRRPGIRQLSFSGVFRHPQRIRRELLYEFSASAIGTDGFVPAIASLTGYDFLDRLPSIAAPTLLIWGRDDLVVPASDAVGYSDRIPGCELQIFAETGHVPMAERPMRFNRVVSEFLGDELPT